ncbi:MAG: pyridoxine 5'-phosphate synthase [Spirochaetia bacterium]|jgi:pyridoxine 5-phosphate synthase|nr:pyridoxine 5'-phosphate synthase [Spirochaetia bacterium]
MPELCVNIDHIATLRQARGGTEPDVIASARVCEANGAAGITVHLREDRRHIQDSDAAALKGTVKGCFNLEMALSDDIIGAAKKIVPDQITIVPEKRAELTTEGGLDVEANRAKIAKIVKEFHEIGVVVSLFIEPYPETVLLSKELGADYVELHTGTYCNAGPQTVRHEIERIYAAARAAASAGIGLNAGHGLNYTNLPPLLKAEGLHELNIGHSIISRAVFTGLEIAVQEMCRIIKQQ